MAFRKYKSVSISHKDHPTYIGNGSNQYINAGFVYIAKLGNLYKVGMTVNPSSRLDSIQTINRKRITDLHIFPADNARLAERGLHMRLKGCRVSGEFFNLTDEQVRELKNIYYYKDGEYLT